MRSISPPWRSRLNLLILIILLGLGLLLRLFNLTNPPLDFQATRQLHSAIISRGMYYEMLPSADGNRHEEAISLWHFQPVYEPPILERLVAWTYLAAGDEILWVARLYSSLFWIIGAVGLYLLSRKISSPGGALLAVSYYLFLEFAVYASRSFQPEPLLTMGLIWTAYAFFRWSENQTIKFALLAGLCAGATVLIKVSALLPVAGILLALLVKDVRQLTKLLRNPQLWLLVFLWAAIPAVYYVFLVGPRSAGFFSFWTLSFARLLIEPVFYWKWLNMVIYQVGRAALWLALLGVLLLPPDGKRLAIGWWLGYFVYGLTLPYQIHTHDYYSLLLVPAVALSLSSLTTKLIEVISGQRWIWRLAAVLISTAALVSSFWIIRSRIMARDYRPEVTALRNMAASLPAGNIIALTQDYGYRMSYYGWRLVQLWPTTADFALDAIRTGEDPTNSYTDAFAEYTQRYSYFLVTDFDQLDAQPVLGDILYDHYPVTEGDGYLLFDLRNPR